MDLESLKRHLDEDVKIANEACDNDGNTEWHTTSAMALRFTVRTAANRPVLRALAEDATAEDGWTFDPAATTEHAARHDPQRVLRWVAAARKVLAGFEAVANNPDRLTDAALHLQFNVLRQVVEAIASVYGEET